RRSSDLAVLLEIAQLRELDLPIEIRLHVVHVASHLGDPFASLPRDAGKPLRADHHQGGDRRDQHLCETDVEHDLCRAPMQGGIRRDGTDETSGSTPLAWLLPCRRGGAQAFGLASTSMVLASCWPGAAGSALPSLTPSLKPRTAPPRSAPMFFSFLVPNTSMMITRTISQCQMLIEPIYPPPSFSGRTATVPGRP